MQKYSVKQFCDITGVPYSTLRYYERIGLLSPHQDENNKYRGYTLTDAFKVNQFKRYRALGFKADEIKELMESKEASLIIDKINSRQDVIEKEVLELQQQYNMLENMKEKIFVILEEEDFRVVEKEDKLFLAASENGMFNVTRYEEFSKWVELLPLTAYSKVLHKEFLLEEGNPYHMDYGISIDVSKSNLLKEELLTNAKLVKLGKCVCFYVLTDNGKIVDYTIFIQLNYFLQQNNLEINGDFYLEGVPIKEKHSSKSVNLVWVSIKEKK